MSSTALDLRCDQNPKRLLARIRDPEAGVSIVEGNLIEVACDYCKSEARRRDSTIKLVVHRWNVLGELIETEVT